MNEGTRKGKRLRVAVTGLALDGGHPTVEALLTQPAVISVPIAFAAMILGSLGGHRSADAELLAMHAPEGLGLGVEEDEPGGHPALTFTRAPGQLTKSDD